MVRLGQLEASVMELLWADDAPEGVSVRQVAGHLPGRPLAYTTVMTVLDNLHRKGLLERTKRGRAYYYCVRLSRAQMWAEAMQELLREAGNTDDVLLHFAQSVSERESDLLRSALQRRRPPT